MASRSVILNQMNTQPVEPVEEPTEEQIAEWEGEQKRERNAQLAPYRALHEQQNEQDDILAELLFKETLREMEE